jgi:hypothetical protein
MLPFQCNGKWQLALSIQPTHQPGVVSTSILPSKVAVDFPRCETVDGQSVDVVDMSIQAAHQPGVVSTGILHSKVTVSNSTETSEETALRRDTVQTPHKVCKAGRT